MNELVLIIKESKHIVEENYSRFCRSYFFFFPWRHQRDQSMGKYRPWIFFSQKCCAFFSCLMKKNISSRSTSLHEFFFLYQIASLHPCAQNEKNICWSLFSQKKLYLIFFTWYYCVLHPLGACTYGNK